MLLVVGHADLVADVAPTSRRTLTPTPGEAYARSTSPMGSSSCLLGQGPGRWLPNSAPPAPPPWHYVNTLDSGLGCWMNESVMLQRNALSFAFDHCPMQPLDKAAICSELAGRELLFVGDSLQGHLYLEFFMMLNGSRSTNKGVCAHYTCYPRRVCTDHVDGGVPMTMVRDDWLALPSAHDEPLDVRGKRPLIHSNRWLKPVHGMINNRTILILTAGSHYFAQSVQLKHMHEIVVSDARSCARHRTSSSHTSTQPQVIITLKP